MASMFHPRRAVLAFPALSPAQDSARAPASATGAVITVEFSNPTGSPSHWVLSFNPDGSGHFQSTMGKADIETPGPQSATAVGSRRCGFLT